MEEFKKKNKERRICTNLLEARRNFRRKDFDYHADEHPRHPLHHANSYSTRFSIVWNIKKKIILKKIKKNIKKKKYFDFFFFHTIVEYINIKNDFL